jgi:hypothetical protein
MTRSANDAMKFSMAGHHDAKKKAANHRKCCGEYF